jgi:phosphoserine phosphatase
MSVHQKLKQILDAGLENLQVVLDFDGTVTEGKSMLALFREEGGISTEYVDKAQALYNHYRPIELRQATNDSEHVEKNKQMEKWWEEHINLLVSYGLDRSHMETLALSKNLSLKKGMKELFEFCNLKKIPVIIFSANVLGTESIRLVLKRFKIDFENVLVYSNDLRFSEGDKFLGIEGEIVHSENKDEHLIRGGLLRPNTILIGDNPSDARMVLDQPGEIVYRIGISHNDEQAHSESYTRVFDDVVAITGTSFDISNLVEVLVEKSGRL